MDDSTEKTEPTPPLSQPPPSIVSRVVSALAMELMRRTLAEGKAIEIPRLGITIQPEVSCEKKKRSDDR